MGILIPPCQELFNLLLLIYIFKIVLNAVVKAFRVRYCISSGENCGGTESKSHL